MSNLTKKTLLIALFLTGTVFLFAQSPKPIPRSRAFFGLHFDLHPGESDKALGADVDEAMVKGRAFAAEVDPRAKSALIRFAMRTAKPGAPADVER